MPFQRNWSKPAKRATIYCCTLWLTNNAFNVHICLHCQVKFTSVALVTGKDPISGYRAACTSCCSTDNTKPLQREKQLPWCHTAYTEWQVHLWMNGSQSACNSQMLQWLTMLCHCECLVTVVKCMSLLVVRLQQPVIQLMTILAVCSKLPVHAEMKLPPQWELETTRTSTLSSIITIN